MGALADKIVGRTSEFNDVHTHTIPTTNTSEVNNVINNAFSIEPSYFSLVFMMKLPANIQQN